MKEILEFNHKKQCGLWLFLIGIVLIIAVIFGGRFFVNPFVFLIGYYVGFFGVGINVLGLSFALSCIKKNTGSVWLCVLFHGIVNALTGIYSVKDNINGNIVATVTLIVSSLVLVKINNVKK